MRAPPTFFPEVIVTSGYVKVFTDAPIFNWFMNSAFVSAVVVMAVVFTSTLGGYIFAKFNFRFKNFLFLLILSTMMVPFQVTMIPTYLICNFLGLINSLWVLIIPSLVSAFGIFLCRQFAASLPNETIEAGRIEGASEYHIFSRLILPSIKPAIAALGIFTFIGKWNDYLWPLIAINDETRMTLPLALNFFNSRQVANMNVMMSASVVIIVPIIIVFLIFQKQFIEGLTLSGLK